MEALWSLPQSSTLLQIFYNLRNWPLPIRLIKKKKKKNVFLCCPVSLHKYVSSCFMLYIWALRDRHCHFNLHFSAFSTTVHDEASRLYGNINNSNKINMMAIPKAWLEKKLPNCFTCLDLSSFKVNEVKEQSFPHKISQPFLIQVISASSFYCYLSHYSSAQLKNIIEATVIIVINILWPCYSYLKLLKMKWCILREQHVFNWFYCKKIALFQWFPIFFLGFYFY